MTGAPEFVNPGEIILYRTGDGQSVIQLRAVDGTVWLTQAEIAELFDTSVQNVSLHVKNILGEGELAPEAVIKESLITAADGKRYRTKLYNLDMILAVGYRVRSPRGSQFRQWATTTLREYLVKGFVLNDERLKEPGGFDYFDELLERIRDIRASEKRFYQKVRDVFATSIDYDTTAETAKTFFATIQNKLVYAVTGHTAAELILERADATAPNMGLTSWKGTVVRKGDVVVSKNYLSSDELDILNTLTTQFLDFAELRARRRQQTTMAEWVTQTDRFLALNEFGILRGAGKVSNAHMKAITEGRYTQFDEQRRELETVRAEQEATAEIESEVERHALAELDAATDNLQRRPRARD